MLIAGVVLWLLFRLNDRIFIPRHARKRVEKLLKSKETANPRVLENSKYGTLVGNAAGLKIETPNRQTADLLWNEIEEIHAFKRDFGTTDRICLAFKRIGKEECCEIHEEMAGCYDLLNAMQNHLPEFNIAWVFEAAFPAFATNHQVIWKRPAPKALGATELA